MCLNVGDGGCVYRGGGGNGGCVYRGGVTVDVFTCG